MPQTVPLIAAVSLAGMPEFVATALGPRAMRRAFDDAGLPLDTQLCEGVFIPEVALLKFLNSAARQSGDEALGAQLGTHLDIAAYGTWGRYVLEGRTLGECLSRFARAVDCFFSYSGFRIVVDGDLAWVRHVYATRGHRHYRQVALASAGSVTNIIRRYVGSDFLPSVVHLDIPRPSRVAGVEDWLPFDIVYNAPEFGLAFPRDLLNAPRWSDDNRLPTTLSTVRRLAAQRSPQRFDVVVQGIVRLQMLSGGPSLDATARALDMTIRTLQREFDRNGLQFRGLAQSVRLDMARALILETDLSIGAVSRTVGYSDPFNFSRAFHRHFERRPSDLRR